MRPPSVAPVLVVALCLGLAGCRDGDPGETGGGGTDSTDGTGPSGGSDETMGPPDIPPGTPCPWPQVACDGTCVDVTADPLHCGNCGRTCDASSSCLGGTCATTCGGLPTGAAFGVRAGPPGSAPGNYVTVRAADLDGDGMMDAVVRSDGFVYAHLGLGDGQVGPPLDGVEIGGLRTSITLVDVDADDVPDVLAAGEDSVWLARGAGDGTFEDPVAVAVDADLRAVADFDGSGTPDLLLRPGVFSDSRLGIAPGAGDGTFGAPTWSGVLPPTGDAAVGDLDGDGDLDVAFEERDIAGLAWMPGDGAGGLGPRNEITIDTSSPDRLEWLGASIDIGRFTGRDRDEVVVTLTDFGMSAPSETFAYRVDEGGALVEVARTVHPEARWQISADLDADGRAEILVVSDFAVVASLDADGWSGEPYAVMGGAGVITGHQMGDLADFDGDGSLDLITGAQWENDGVVSVVTHVDHGIGSPSATRLWLPDSSELAVADLDKDGHADIVGTGLDTAIAFGGPEGELDVRSTSTSALGRPAIGDIDADGDLDAVVGGDALVVLRNDGDRAMSPQLLSDEPAENLHVVDVNDDGHTDIIAGGGARLGPAFDYVLALGSSRVVAVADLDGDGLVDLLGDQETHHNLGGGMFEEWVGYPSAGLREAVIADLDGNGVPDYVGRQGSFLGAGLGQGDGSFAFVPGLGGGLDDPYAHAAVADLDGDGRDEVLTLGAPGPTEVVFTAWIHALEGSELVLTGQLPIAREPRAIVVGDLSGDGILDIVTAHETGDTMPSLAVALLACP